MSDLGPDWVDVYTTDGTGKLSIDIVPTPEWNPLPPSSSVGLTCTMCGKACVLFHTYDAPQTITIVCICGNRIEWTTPTMPTRRGFGVAMSQQIPANIEPFKVDDDH